MDFGSQQFTKFVNFWSKKERKYRFSERTVFPTHTCRARSVGKCAGKNLGQKTVNKVVLWSTVYKYVNCWSQK